MKQIFKSVLMLLSTVALMVTCNWLPPELAPSTGSIEVNLDYLVGKTIAPQMDMTPASYSITGDGPDDAAFTIETTNTKEGKDSLVCGDWTITVAAYNKEKFRIASGFTVVTVKAGETAEAIVHVTPLEGTGDLDLCISGQGGSILDYSLEAVLVPLSSGITVGLEFEALSETGSYVCRKEGIGNGYYKLLLSVKNNDLIVAGLVEVVWIISNQVTEGDFLFILPENNLVTIEIIPDIAMPINIEIINPPATMNQSETIVLETEVNSVLPVGYEWYVNSIYKGDGASYTIKNMLPGFYNVSVVVYCAEKISGGSDCISFEVTAGTIEPPLPAMYSLTVHNDPEEGGSVSPGSGLYDSGSVVTLEALPAEHYSFTGWSGDLNGNTNPATLVVDKDMDVTAHFAVNRYTLTATVVGSGTVSPATGTFDNGTQVTLTATPAACSRFTGWSGALSGMANPADLIITGNLNVIANFEPIYYTVTPTVTGNGSIGISPVAVSYACGSNIMLTATPAACYRFTGWSGDINGSTNPMTITMSKNMNVSAVFERIIYTIGTGVATGSGNVTPGISTYYCSDTVTLTATPAACYRFTGWSGDGSGTTNPYSLTVNKNMNIYANFELVQYTLTVNASGPGSVSPSLGSYNCGSTVVLTASPSTCSRFLGWGGDASGLASSLPIIITRNMNVTAYFELGPTFWQILYPAASWNGYNANYSTVGSSVSITAGQGGGSLTYTMTSGIRYKVTGQIRIYNGNSGSGSMSTPSGTATATASWTDFSFEWESGNCVLSGNGGGTNTGGVEVRNLSFSRLTCN